MPNWCEGILKVRGKKENLKNFLKDNIKNVDITGEEKPINIIEEEDENSIYFNSKHSFLYLKGTSRGFIEPIYNKVYFYETDKKDIFIILLEYKQAWGIICKELKNISNKFNIDIKIHGFEKGMEFEQDIEIINGKIIKDEEVKYKDYNWESINPTLGG